MALVALNSTTCTEPVKLLSPLRFVGAFFCDRTAVTSASISSMLVFSWPRCLRARTLLGWGLCDFPPLCIPLHSKVRRFGLLRTQILLLYARMLQLRFSCV